MEQLKNTKFWNIMKNLLNTLFIFTITALNLGIQAFELSPSVLQAEQAVYKVTTSLKEGTGFFIAPDIFVTNFHVIDDIKSLDEISLDHQDRPSIGVHQIAAVSIFADIALFQTKEKSSAYLSEGTLTDLSENLVMIGHIQGANTAQYIKSTEPSTEWEGMGYLTPSHFLNDSGGFSGSPLINLNGEFLGVVSNSNNHTKLSISSKYVFELLEGHIGASCSNIECIDQETLAMQKFVSNQLQRGFSESEPTLFHHSPYFLITFLNSESMISYLELGGENNSPTAKYHLGVIYEQGIYGVEQDFERAVYWYQKAENQNDNAKYNLCAAYREGRGIKQNFNKAIECYRQLAERGDPSAQHSYGAMLFEGQGVDQNIPLALTWITKSARQNNPFSQQILSMVYEQGIGVPKNMETASYWQTQFEIHQ